MKESRALPPDFLFFLDHKEDALKALFLDCRSFIFELHDECNELLYHTQALTSVFSISEKLSDGFCHLPMYSKHMNFGFNKGSLLPDPKGLLKGTGKLIRHLEINTKKDYRNPAVKALVKAAIDLAIEDMDKPSTSFRKCISKIKPNKNWPKV